MKKIFTTLMLAQAIFWLVLVIFTPNNNMFVNILLIINCTLFIFFAFLGNKNLLFKIGTIGFLTANTILTLTDQVGLFDYIILVVNIISIIIFSYILIRNAKTKS